MKNLVIISFALTIAMSTIASAGTPVTNCGNLIIEGETYVLSNDIIASGTCFTIGANNITLDGNGHMITGDGTGDGVSISEKKDVTIINLKVQNAYTGIYMNTADQKARNTLENNILIYNNNGIIFLDVQGTTVKGNRISNNHYGMLLREIAFNNISENMVSNNDVGISLYGDSLTNTLTGNIVSNNTGISTLLNFSQF